MEIKSPGEMNTRMIHVRLPEKVHKKLRIRAAEDDKTIQDWVLQAIVRELKRTEGEKSTEK